MTNKKDQKPCLNKILLLLMAQVSILLTLASPAWAIRCHSVFARASILMNQEIDFSDANSVSSLKNLILSIFKDLNNGTPLEKDESTYLQKIIADSQVLDLQRRNDLSSFDYTLKNDLRRNLDLINQVLEHKFREIQFLETIHERAIYDMGWENLVIKHIRERTPEGIIFERIGYRSDGYAPTLAEVYSNTVKIYDSKGVPQSERLLPSLFYVKSGTSGTEFKHVSFEEGPPIGADWVLTSPSGMKSRFFTRAIADGYIPLSGTHDVGGHLISVLMNDGYRNSILKGYRAHVQQGPSLRRSRWTYFLYELLSLPDATMREQIAETLKYPEFSEKPSKLDRIRTFFESLSDVELFQHAESLAGKYEGFFKHYGGAFVNPPERASFLVEYNATPGNLRESLLQQTVTSQRGPPKPWDSYFFMGHELRQALSIKGKESELAAAKLFGKDDFDRSFTPEKLRKVVVDYVSRMEYTLWEGQKFSASQLPDQILSGPAGNAEPFLEFLKNSRTAFSWFYLSLRDANDAR